MRSSVCYRIAQQWTDLVDLDPLLVYDFEWERVRVAKIYSILNSNSRYYFFFIAYLNLRNQYNPKTFLFRSRRRPLQLTKSSNDMKSYSVFIFLLGVFVCSHSAVQADVYLAEGEPGNIFPAAERAVTLVKRAIIVAGQSNTCSGAGDVILPPDFARKRMSQLGRNNDNLNELPLSFYNVQHFSPYTNRASFASMFCYYYYDLLKSQNPDADIQLLLIPSGAGGSGWSDSQYPYNSWRTDANYFKDLVTRIKWAKNAGYQIDAFLWHQGETDASYVTPNYKDILINFIQSMRDHVGNPNLPFVLGQMVPAWVAADPSRVPYQVVIDSVPTQVPYTYTVSGNSLTSNYQDLIHYSAAAHYELGKRYYDGFLSAQNNSSPAAYTVPGIGESLLLNHNVAGGLFSNPLDAMRKNDGNPSYDVYSKLGDIWKFKNSDGYYHFKLVVVAGGNLTNKYFEWKQRYSPFSISDAFAEERADKDVIANTLGIDTTINSQGFASLVYYSTRSGGPTTTLFHGDIRYSIANWWLSVGAISNYNGHLPIKDDGQNSVTHIRLYAIKD